MYEAEGHRKVADLNASELSSWLTAGAPQGATWSSPWQSPLSLLLGPSSSASWIALVSG